MAREPDYGGSRGIARVAARKGISGTVDMAAGETWTERCRRVWAQRHKGKLAPPWVTPDPTDLASALHSWGDAPRPPVAATLRLLSRAAGKRPISLAIAAGDQAPDVPPPTPTPLLIRLDDGTSGRPSLWSSTPDGTGWVAVDEHALETSPAPWAKLVGWWHTHGGQIWAAGQAPAGGGPDPVSELPKYQAAAGGDPVGQLSLLDVGAAEPSAGHLTLPAAGIGGAGGKAIGGWLLDCYDQSAPPVLSPGRGAPWTLRLFVGALLHTPPWQRQGRPSTFAVPAPDVVRWLFPNRRWKNRSRDWQRLPEALLELHNMRVRIGDHLISPVAVPVIPATPDALRTGHVAFTVYIPTASARGARIHWPTLAAYGVRSAPLYRGYLSAMSLIDHTATQGHPVRPDASERRRQRIPALTTDELTRAVGYSTPGRMARSRGLDVYQQLEADGHIEMEQTPNGLWRVYGTASYGPQPSELT